MYFSLKRVFSFIEIRGLVEFWESFEVVRFRKVGPQSGQSDS